MKEWLEKRSLEAIAEEGARESQGLAGPDDWQCANLGRIPMLLWKANVADLFCMLQDKAVDWKNPVSFAQREC